MIIDFHIHTFPDSIADKAVKKLSVIGNTKAYTNGTVTDTLRIMKSAGIDRGVLLNIATSPGQHISINNAASTLNGGAPFWSFGSVYPTDPSAAEEVRRAGLLGLKGIKFHPDYQEFFPDDESVFPVYEECEAMGMAVVFHAGEDLRAGVTTHCTPQRLLALHRCFPSLKIIAAHLGGLFMWNAVDCLCCEKNIYFDTAYLCGHIVPSECRKIIVKHGTDKILFGSDCPWSDPAHELNFIESLGLSSSDLDRILFENSLEFLS